MKVLLGDYPGTHSLRTGKIPSGSLKLEFADVKQAHQAFKRVVRDLEFDIAELAIVTFLLAKAHGKPYRLLPAVVTARFQHPYLVCLLSNRLSPGDLSGKTIGQRSYSVTTATWLRGILADDHGVDLESVRWVTFEEPHVAEFRDPPNVTRAPAGKDILSMLLAGELDAAIMTDLPKDDPRVVPVFPDAAAAAEAWKRRTGASIQINHMVVAKAGVSPSVSSSFYELLKKSRDDAGSSLPFGIEENRRNLEAAIDCTYRQNMIPRRYAVEELFE
jgi:4,5-dihydroxyphthalate decarboxylase